MKAIITKYLPATLTMGPRIKCYNGDYQLIISYPHEGKDPHETAVIKFCKKYGFHGVLTGPIPTDKNNDKMVWVFDTRKLTV